MWLNGVESFEWEIHAKIKVTGYERNVSELNDCYLGPKINVYIGKYTYFNVFLRQTWTTGYLYSTLL